MSTFLTFPFFVESAFMLSCVVFIAPTLIFFTLSMAVRSIAACSIWFGSRCYPRIFQLCLIMPMA